MALLQQAKWHVRRNTAFNLWLPKIMEALIGAFASLLLSISLVLVRLSSALFATCPPLRPPRGAPGTRTSRYKKKQALSTTTPAHCVQVVGDLLPQSLCNKHGLKIGASLYMLVGAWPCSPARASLMSLLPGPLAKRSTSRCIQLVLPMFCAAFWVNPSPFTMCSRGLKPFHCLPAGCSSCAAGAPLCSAQHNLHSVHVHTPLQVHVAMWASAPVSWPLSKVLDWIVGTGPGSSAKKHQV